VPGYGVQHRTLELRQPFSAGFSERPHQVLSSEKLARSGAVRVVVVVGVLTGIDAEELSGLDRVLGTLPVGKQAVVSNAVDSLG